MAEVAALRHESQDLDLRLHSNPADFDVQDLGIPVSNKSAALSYDKVMPFPHAKSDASTSSCCEARVSSPTEEPMAEPGSERTPSPSVVGEALPQAPSVPKAVARPPRRPRPQPQPQEFPSDEQMANMTRKERIALMEREEQGPPVPARAPAPVQPRQPQEFPSDELMANMTRKERIAMMEREEQGSSASARAHVPAPRQQVAPEFPSNEQMASLTRKERIALMEQEEQGTAPVQASAPAPMRCQQPEFVSDEKFASMSRKERIAMMEQEAQGTAPVQASAPAPARCQQPELVSDEQFATMSRKERIAMMEREEQMKASSSGAHAGYMTDHVGIAPEQPPMNQRPPLTRRREERQPRSEASTGTMSPRGPSPVSTPSHPEKPRAAATPRRREDHRPQATQSFPSDEEFGKMSRKERIALMEREANGYQDGADGMDQSNGRLAKSQPPQGRQLSEMDEFTGANAGFTARDVSGSPVSGVAARRRARGSANSDPDRYDGSVEASRAARRPPAQRPRPPEISDEAFATMSRKERIALLERESGAPAKADMRAASPRLPPIEQPSPRCNTHNRGPPRIPSVGPRGGSVDDGGDQPIGGDEEAAFEERRKQRRMRLQNRQRADSSGQRTGEAVDSLDPMDDLKSAVRDRNQTSKGDSAAMRETPLQKGDRRQASTGSSAQPTTGKLPKQLIDDLEAAASGPDSASHWSALCKDLAATAHRLQPSEMLRSVSALSACAGAGWLDDAGSSVMKEAVDALLASVSSHLGSMDSSHIGDLLHVMAVARISEQTYLDMILAQLLVVLRRNDAALTPRVLAVLAGSIATLHTQGLSAKKAGSGASSSANKRCMDSLNQKIGEALADFADNEFARVGGPYIVVFFEDSQRRTYLARAAELDVGLRSESSKHLEAMKAVEVAVRKHSFAFIATLPDATKDYLAKLKMTSL
eukprot:gnl/MRDRNA2_/MRDRNA2_113131_c0_seq1.p1 gnl/MRDRNA2_/MRDRNA2_113131_c0~~gnl/MRDRNA2_/MRDRNA2_113131_c0_seq1.p1  ORF type:complete len:975 (+),score=216.16 gnl/MRDRNA2_/MRDRNA2_113131_c0_seq1:116-2926(+)